MPERAPGFYWVRLGHRSKHHGCWEVARWEAGTWDCCGTERGYGPDAMAEVGARLLAPGESERETLSECEVPATLVARAKAIMGGNNPNA